MKFNNLKSFILNNRFLLMMSSLLLLLHIQSLNYNFILIFTISCILSLIIDKTANILQYISMIRMDNGLKKTRLELAKSEKKFRNLFNVSTVPMAILNIRTRKFVGVNKKLCELLQYSEEELMNNTYESFIYKDDILLTNNKISDMNNVYDENNPIFTNRYVTKSGKVISITWTGTDSYDELVYYIAIPNYEIFVKFFNHDNDL